MEGMKNSMHGMHQIMSTMQQLDQLTTQSQRPTIREERRNGGNQQQGQEYPAQGSRKDQETRLRIQELPRTTPPLIRRPEEQIIGLKQFEWDSSSDEDGELLQPHVQGKQKIENGWQLQQFPM